MESPPIRILLVEDDEIIALHLTTSLRNIGYQIVAQTNRGEESITLCAELRPDIVLMDIQLAGEMTGVQAAEEIRKLVIPVVFLTSYSDPTTLRQVKGSRPFGYIVKPFTVANLQSTLELALHLHRTEVESLSLARFPDESPYPIMRISQDGTILYANRACEPLITPWNCLPGGRIHPTWQPYLDQALQGRCQVFELTCGEQVFSCTLTPIVGEKYVNLYAYDVTDRHNLETELRESQDKYRLAAENNQSVIRRLNAIIENLPVVVFVIDREGIFRVSEGKSLASLGFKAGQVVGQSVYDIYRAYPEIIENVRAALKGETREYTVQVGERIYHTHVDAITNENGQIDGILGVSTDVTDLVVVDQARREGEERFRRLAEASFEGLAFIREGRFLQVNQQFADMVGSTTDRLIGREILEFVAPEARHLVLEHIQNTNLDPYEFLALREDGSRFPVEVRVRQIPYGGETIRVSAIRDMTQRKRAERSLIETQERLNLALRAARMGIWDWDLITDQVTGDEEVMAIYTGVRRPLDTTVQEILTYVYPDDRQKSIDEFYQAAHNPGRQFDLEYRVRWLDGSLHTIAIRGHVYRTDEGRAVRMIGVTWDVTERRAIEEEIRRLNAELEQRVNQRTAQLQDTLRELETFSYSVSHDLRSPLRAMNGYSRMLEEDYAAVLDANALQYLHRIRESSRRMAQLIDDLLNLSRYARANLHVEDIDLSLIATQILSDLEMQNPERRVEWVVTPGLRAKGDHQLVRVVLNNLLENAWKFTSFSPHAHIEMGTEERAGRSVFFIRDNGAGFDMAYAGKLFGAFQRLHGPNEFEGTGIGLATVQRIIRRHGGDVWAEGETGQGATFYFTLP